MQFSSDIIVINTKKTLEGLALLRPIVQ